MPNSKSRVRLEHLASRKSITNTHKNTTESLIKFLLSGYLLSRRELNTIARCLDIKSPIKISSNELFYILRKYLVAKNLEDLSLNKLSKRHI